MQLLGPGSWFGVQALTGLDVALIDLGVATAMLVLVFRSRVWAATLAEAGLLVLGGYGLLIIAFWPAVDGILAVSSPPGGPTIVVIEVPCALSSAKTSSC